MITDTDLAHREQRLAMDQATVRRHQAVEQMRLGIERMNASLVRAGFLPHRIGEHRDPDTGMVVGTTYCGSEYTVAIHQPGRPLVRVRVTQAQMAREPDCFEHLTGVLFHVSEGQPLIVHAENSGIVYGLEAGGLVFGLRPADLPVFPAEDADEPV